MNPIPADRSIALQNESIADWIITAKRVAIESAIVAILSFVTTLLMHELGGFELCQRSWLHLPLWIGVTSSVIFIASFSIWAITRKVMSAEEWVKRLLEDGLREIDALRKQLQADSEKIKRECQQITDEAYQKQQRIINQSALLDAQLEAMRTKYNELSLKAEERKAEIEREKKAILDHVRREAVATSPSSSNPISIDDFSHYNKIITKGSEQNGLGEARFYVHKGILVKRWGNVPFLKKNTALERTWKIGLSNEEFSTLMHWTYFDPPLSNYSIKDLFTLYHAADFLLIEKLEQSCLAEVLRRLSDQPDLIEAACEEYFVQWEGKVPPNDPLAIELQSKYLLQDEERRLTENPKQLLRTIISYWKSCGEAVDADDKRLKMMLRLYFSCTCCDARYIFGVSSLSTEEKQTLQTIFSSNPNDIDYLLALGWGHSNGLFGEGDADLVASSFLQASRINENDPKVQHAMGFIFQKGLSVQKNEARARDLMQRSASQGYVPSQLSHTIDYLNDKREKHEIYRKAATKGNLLGINYYAESYFEFNQGDQSEGNEVMRLLNIAISRGSRFARCWLARAYLYGQRGVAVDRERAIQLLTEASDYPPARELLTAVVNG